MTLWRVTVTYTTPAGATRTDTLDVERETAQEAEEAAAREVLRQPGREIVGIETERADGN